MTDGLTLAPHATQPPIIDVWSRTAPKYRIRALVLLFVLAVLFAGLCCFTYWLRTGIIAPWEDDRYADLIRRSFNPSGPDQVTLSDFLTSPINVQDVPIHIVILGLLFASLSSIPVLVAILYRFPVSAIFCGMIAGFAALPWLALTVLLGCALASLRPLRFTFRYASALLGLVPVGVYFVLASWEPSGGSRVKATQHQALLYAPWVLALLSSCVICAVGLAIARLINYRPGGISPVLATLFALPVVLFHTKVGRDELEYRVLEREIGPGSTTMFQPQSVGDLADRQATRLWSESRAESYERIRGRMLDQETEEVLRRAEEDRLIAADACESFIIRFPKSRYVPNVLYLKGRALDQRLHKSKLESQHYAEFRDDAPTRASLQTWQTIQERFPGGEPGAVALYKLAVLEGREGRLDAALELLNTLITRFGSQEATTRPAAAGEDLRTMMFHRAEPSATLALDLPNFVMQARLLREMLAACRDDAPRPEDEVFGPRSSSPATPAHPVSVLLSLDETDPRYAFNLEQLAARFPDTRTAEYVRLRRLRLDPALSRRIQGFRAAAQAMALHPAGAEALYALADVLQEDSLADESRAVFEELIKNYPQSCWADRARDRLGSLSLRERTPST